MIVPILAHHHHSEPAPAPHCPHCGTDLPGWSPPTDSGCLLFGLLFVACILLALAALFTLVNWTSSEPPQTLVQTIIYEWQWVVNLLKRVW